MTRSERHAFRLAFAAWLLGIFAFFIPAATWSPVSRFALTRAMAERGSVSIDPHATSTGDRARVGEHWYSDKAPIPSMLAVPSYTVVRGFQSLRGDKPDYRAFSTPETPALRVRVNVAFQRALYVCSVATSGLSGVAVGLLLFEILRRRTTARAAFVGSVVTTLGTPLFPYATSFYGHVPAAAFLLGALVALDPRGSHPPGMPSARRLRIAGACLALTPGSEYLTAVPVALVGLWFLLRVPAPQRLRTVLELGIGAVVPVLLVAGYHTLAFGAPWKTGYSFIVQPEFAAGHAQGFLGIRWLRPDAIFGLTFGVRRGLFYIAPVALLGLVIGVRYAWRRKDWTLGAGFVVLAVLFALNASYYMWWGGASAGPRHLIPALPVLGLGVGIALMSRRRWLRLLTIVLGAVSIANCLAIGLVGLEAPENGDVLRNFVWPRLVDGDVAKISGASNIGLKMGLPGAASVVPLLIWGALGYRYLLKQTHRNRR